MWVCPTLGRPERLSELARSWERCQPHTKLAVKLWVGDPRLEDYAKHKWPKGWHFYRSEVKYLGPSLNEFFKTYPEEKSYGFIADDIVLRTKGGLELLESLAEPFFVVYPNDCLQRNRLCTHFCIGGDLVRELGWFTLPQMMHSVDMPWWNLGRNTGLLRYEPRVVFQHKHFLTGQAERDSTYEVTYKKDRNQPSTELHAQDHAKLEAWCNGKHAPCLAKDVLHVMRLVTVGCEDWDEWDAQDRADSIVVPQAAVGVN